MGRSAGRAGALLIGAQVAVCAMLLIATGLLLESFARVLRVDRGFRADHVLTLDMSLPIARYRMPVERRTFYDDVVRRVGAIPGVHAVGLTSALPLDGESQVDNLSLVNDQRPEGQRPLGNIRYVTDGYFTALGVPLVGGRAFGANDRNGGVTMLSRRAAHLLFPGVDAVGKTVVPGSNDNTAVVVGVVPDLFTGSLESEAALAAYLSLWNQTRRDFTIVVRTTSDPVLSTDAIRAELRRIDATVPIGRVRTMEQIVAGTLAQRRFALVLIGLFAVTSLLTASLGIYGVVAQSLGRRTTEIGIRMALGARAADIHRQIMRRELTPVVAGLLAGVTAELLLGRVVESLLFQVRADDPRIFIAVSAVLGVVVFAACYIPARRTTRYDVAAALRAD
jgi:putative ABC transport system permease protein